MTVYGVADPALANWLGQLAGNSRRRGWLADVRKHPPPEFHQFLDWETALVARRQFSTLLVPGLLQTTEYARCLISGVNPELTGDEDWGVRRFFVRDPNGRVINVLSYR
ncbi:Scr1 family TA system antitoxin-like transcriptional regulator [Saccharomonospora iraqiensis]|uniref:Scr1 family TA system antitoxin-like transcriptional regulator n=1 Tax=Saccharomonospora iraqiensis TaxID=52698 RepID=UPI0004192158|nr:Scr1 family TA system antitoxin-like transcriptional regulator [Saccharomonospora iraqiensis]